jgi:hypothetical protein
MPPNSCRKSNVHPTLLQVSGTCYKAVAQRRYAGTAMPFSRNGASRLVLWDPASHTGGHAPSRACLGRLPSSRRQPFGHLPQVIPSGCRKAIATHHHSRSTKSNRLATDQVRVGSEGATAPTPAERGASPGWCGLRRARLCSISSRNSSSVIQSDRSIRTHCHP